jgi:hypothetical protein
LPIHKDIFPIGQVADLDRDYFGKLDPDPHKSEKLDRDPHVSKNKRASDAQIGAVDVQKGGSVVNPDPHQLKGRILIRIKVISWIRIHIKVIS